MSVRVAKVDAPAAVPGVELPILKIPRVAAARDPCLLHLFHNGVELLIAHMKRVVMDIEPVDIVVEIEGEPVIDAHRREIPACALIEWKSEYLREACGRCDFSARRPRR